MKKLLLALTLILGMAWVSLLPAETHRSDMGFSARLPTGWLVIGRHELKANPSVLESALGKAETGPLKTADKDVIGQLKAMVLAGKVEYFWNRSHPGSVISVNRGEGAIPQSADEISRTCEALAADLSRLAGKPTKVYECELRRMGNMKAFYTVADGLREGSKSLQYQIQQLGGEILFLTATCPVEHCNAVSTEFDAMLSSIKLE